MNKITCASQNTDAIILPAGFWVSGRFGRLTSCSPLSWPLFWFTSVVLDSCFIHCRNIPGAVLSSGRIFSGQKGKMFNQQTKFLFSYSPEGYKTGDTKMTATSELTVGMSWHFETVDNFLTNLVPKKGKMKTFFRLLLRYQILTEDINY